MRPCEDDDLECRAARSLGARSPGSLGLGSHSGNSIGLREYRLAPDSGGTARDFGRPGGQVPGMGAVGQGR